MVNKDKGTPYKPLRRRELDAIEARRRAAGVTVDELAFKAGLNRATYYRVQKSGRAFKRHVVALAMALRTLEGEARRESEAFPFAVRPAARPGQLASGGSLPGSGQGLGLGGSGPGQPRVSGSGPGQPQRKTRP